MTSMVDSVRFFPLKGGQAQVSNSLEVNSRVGVVGDRQFAIKKKAVEMGSRPKPFKKGEYFVCANTAGMAAMSTDFIVGKNGWVDDTALSSKAKAAGIEDPLHLQYTEGRYHLCDTSGPHVSFLNLATLQAFERFMGVSVDPDRFRMNVWITGLPAFAEYDWVDTYPGTREIRVGDVRLRIDDACERCKAPHANPKTGKYDLDVVPGLKRFMETRGYKSPQRGVATVMGVYGEVLNDGIIGSGDRIRFV
jgi:uncharacterized protein YcbX